jgi:hypothetical protein
LRCKIKKETTEEVVALFRRLEGVSRTKSGKMFEVIRVKNRFQTNNKDLLVNFRYGDVLVGEAQLGLENEETQLPKVAKLDNAVSHFFYELERSIFGPTLELMMQYEDVQRPDIAMRFEAEGRVELRKDKLIHNAETTDRVSFFLIKKCLHGHEMLSLVGNYFIQADDPTEG